MPRLSGSRVKRKTSLHTAHHGSYDSLWFEALEILDENDSEFLVRWAGKDPSSGQEWPPSWTPKTNCSPALVKRWKAHQKKKISNTQLSTLIPVVCDQAPTLQPAPARRVSTRLSAAGQTSSKSDTPPSSTQLPRRSTRTVTFAGTTVNQLIPKSRPIPPTVATSPPKRKAFPSPEVPLGSLSDSQDTALLSNEDNWFEALGILAQNGDKFEVSWAGIDPSTGKQWAPTWVWRKDCTPALLHSWKVKQVDGKMEF